MYTYIYMYLFIYIHICICGNSHNAYLALPLSIFCSFQRAQVEVKPPAAGLQTWKENQKPKPDFMNATPAALGTQLPTLVAKLPPPSRHLSRTRSPLSLSLSLSLSLAFFLSVFLPVCLSLFPSFFLPLSLSPSLSRSLPNYAPVMALSLSLSLSMYTYISTYKLVALHADARHSKRRFPKGASRKSLVVALSLELLPELFHLPSQGSPPFPVPQMKLG